MGARAHLQLLRASGRALFISERHLRIDFRSSPGWRIRRKKANREEQYRDPQERHCIDHAEAEEQNMERVRRADSPMRFGSCWRNRSGGQTNGKLRRSSGSTRLDRKYVARDSGPRCYSEQRA